MHDNQLTNDRKGRFDLEVNDGGDDLTCPPRMRVYGETGYMTLGSVQDVTNAADYAIRIANSVGSAAAIDQALTITFDNTNVSALAGTYPIGSIDFHGNFSGNDGVSCRVYATGDGPTGDGTLRFSTGPNGAASEVMNLSKTGCLFIGSGGPNTGTSTALHIGAAKALRLGQLTTTERNGLTPINGMLIYNTTLGKFEAYENGGWANLI